jgi:hypothetical protein
VGEVASAAAAVISVFTSLEEGGVAAPKGERLGKMKRLVTTTRASATAIPVWVGCINYNILQFDYTTGLEKP